MKKLLNTLLIAEWVCFIVGALFVVSYQFVGTVPLVYGALLSYCTGFMIMVAREIVFMLMIKRANIEGFVLSQTEENKTENQSFEEEQNKTQEESPNNEEKVQKDFEETKQMTFLGSFLRLVFAGVLLMLTLVVLVLY